MFSWLAYSLSGYPLLPELHFPPGAQVCKLTSAGRKAASAARRQPALEFWEEPPPFLTPSKCRVKDFCSHCCAILCLLQNLPR